jgi:kinesin family member 1
MGDSGALAQRVEVSYLEIYQERIRDLLNTDKKAPSKTGVSNPFNLRLREHPSTGPFVEGLLVLPVTSLSELLGLIERGNRTRTVASTRMNDVSSRSHAIFTIRYDRIQPGSGADLLEGATERRSRIHLVDLAGR